MTPAGVLADPRVRLGAGTAALLVTAMAARRKRVGADEARGGCGGVAGRGP